MSETPPASEPRKMLRFHLDSERHEVAYIDPAHVVSMVEKQSRQVSGAYVDVTRFTMTNGEAFQVYGHVAKEVAEPEP